MVIPEQFRKCVVFLYADVPGKARQPAGTAFIAALPTDPPADAHTQPPLGPGEGWHVHYLVTARHVVALSRKYGSLFARLHFRDGTTAFTEFSQDSWHQT